MNLRANRFRTLPFLVAFLLNVVVGPLSPLAPVASTALALSGSSFDATDGNFVVNGGETDWCSAGLTVVSKDDLPTGQNDDSYAEGAKEEDTNPPVEFGSIPNNKVDLTRIHVAGETAANGDLFVYVGWLRSDDNGTGTVSFEMNQSGVIQSNGVNPVRTAGDLLITFNFHGGGFESLTVRAWTGSAWGAETDLVAGGLGEGSVNAGAVTDCDGGSVPALHFGEFSFNLTDLIGGDCRAFANLFAKSRASNSIESKLKELLKPLGIDLSTCGEITIDKQDQNGDPLGGATFSVSPNPFTGSGSLNVTDNAAPDDDSSDGVIHLSAVEPGDYEVCETDAPDGYIIDTNCQILTVAQNGSASFGPFVNGLGDISWEKLDQQTDAKLCCATFTLEGTGGAADGFGPVTVTDNGQNDEDSDDGELLVTGLLLGTYRITETISPDGYDLPNPAFMDVVLNGESASPEGAFEDAPRRDPSVEKTAVLDPVVAGHEAGFDIVVTAGGVGDSENVVLSDDNPADSGKTWTVSGPDSGDCADLSVAPGESLSCDFGTMPNGETRSVTISMTALEGDCQDGIANTATITADDDVDLSNNESSDHISVLCPNPGVVKSADVDPIVFGDPASFTIVVTAGGTGDAANVVLSDVNPAGSGRTWAVSGDDAAECADLSIAPGETLSCDFGTIQAGETRTVTITADSIADDCAEAIANTATITADDDVDTSNNSSSDSITVLCPNPGVEKTADADPVNAGDPASFTIVVTASGGGDSENVVLSDDNPAGSGHTWTVSGANANACADLSIAPGETLSCDFGTIPNGQSRSVNIEMTSNPSDCAAGIANTATITADADVDLSDNESSDSIAVDCPDIAVEKTGSGTVNATDSIYFEITVSNIGDGDASNFTFSDTLPDVANGWTLVQPAEDGCSLVVLALSCSMPLFESGDSFVLRVEADSDVADCGDLPNTASASASNEPQDLLDNNSDGHTIVVQCPELDASKQADDTVVSAGQPIGFTITVSNSAAPGTGTAYDVELNDPLPAGSDLDWEMDPDNAACDITGSLGAETLECSFGDLVAGGSVSVHVVSDTSKLDCTTFPNVASVTADNHDELNPSDDTTVECPGLNISKVADNGQIVAGDTASYAIVVWNRGPGTALNASWSDELPHGVSWSVELLSPDGDDACASSIDSDGNQSASCSFGDLASSSMADGKRIVISGETDREDCAGLDNTAFAFADNADTVHASALIGVRCPFLVIDKSADTEEVHFVFDADANVLSVDPEQVTWTLTYTLTDGPVTDAVITDSLPEFLDFVSASDGGVYDVATRTITWELGDLLVDGTFNVSFVTTVDPAAPETDPILNVATIVSNETPEDDGEDSIVVTSESELGGNPTPEPSVPNTAVVFGPAGEPVSIPVELLVFLFIGSLGTLAFANVRATRRRR